MANVRFLTLPGWQDSDPEHWQSLWEQRYGDLRVQQHDWLRPLRGDWITRLEDVVSEQTGSVVLVAHSLGCLLTAAWAAQSRQVARVRFAMLVAPPDPGSEPLRNAIHSWSPVVLQRLPFPSLVLASTNDVYCDAERARQYAHAWASDFVVLGAHGHINTASGFGAWPEGRALLQRALAKVDFPEVKDTHG